MTEGQIQAAVRLSLGRLRHVRLFRNNIGVAFHADGSRVVYGVANPGGSDLLGWTERTITADMLGQKIAVFTAAEVKASRGGPSREQLNFLRVVSEAGGIAGVVRSPEDALRLVSGDGALL